MKRYLVALSALLCALLVAPDARADEPRTHDGLYFTFALGPSYSRTTFDSGNDLDLNLDSQVSVTGIGVSGALLLGGTVKPGFVIGGGMMGFHAVKPSINLGSASTSATRDIVGSVTGPFVTWYMDPSGGLYLLGQLGAGILQPAEQDSAIAVGFGATVAVGHDWFVTDSLSLGVLGRMQFLNTSSEDFPNARFNTLVPAVNATLTFH